MKFDVIIETHLKFDVCEIALAKDGKSMQRLVGLFVDLTMSNYDRHSVYYLHPVLKKVGFELHYIQSTRVDEIINYIDEHGINFVFYTSFSSKLVDYVTMDKELKLRRPHLFSLLGGAGVTQRAERVMMKNMGTTIDAFCIGEGEAAIRNFFDQGMVFHKNIIRPEDVDSRDGYYDLMDVNELDFPDRDMVYQHDPLLRDMPAKQFMGSRGCPYKCTYCHNSSINQMFKSNGPIMRIKDVDYLIDEVNEVAAKFPLRTVIFQDDIFFFNRKWAYEFAEKWPSRVGLPWTANIRADYINEDLVRAMKASGCIAVSWSIESGNEFFRNRILGRRMKEEMIINCADLLNKYGINHRPGNIIGSPGETLENMHETIELNIKVKPSLANAHIFIPFKGLQLTNYALEHGYLDSKDVVDLPGTFFEHSVLNFPQREKAMMRKLMFLFPIFVGAPFLYKQNILRNSLLKFNDRLLSFMNKMYVGYTTAKIYGVKTRGMLLNFKLMLRFLKFGL